MLGAPLRGGGGSDGCARGSDTSARPSQWSSPRPCVTAVIWGLGRTQVYGHRRRRAQGRWRLTRRTLPHGDRSSLHRGCGPAVSLTWGRSLWRSARNSLPTLALPILAGSAGEVVDSSSLCFLTASALEARREEEEEKVKEKERKHLAVHETLERARLWAEEKERRLAVHEAATATLEQARLWAEEKAKRRKRKKRRKRRTPRTSSRSLRGRGRHRQRQWHACNAGFSSLRSSSRCSPFGCRQA